MLDPSTTPTIGKYRLLEHLGSGSMASVYKVRHEQLQADYALKVLDGTAGRMADRLLREGRVQAGLRHPNVVTVHDVLEVEGLPALLMDYVDGPTLSSHLLAEHPLEVDEIDRLAIGILKGVRAVHQAGHLHRDLKPSNILLATQDGELVARIADFGLAKMFGDPNDPIQTRSGQLLGSPAYMSPEQTLSATRLDERTDIWAVGAVLYQLLTGELAFPHRDIVTIFSMIRSGDFRDPRSLRPGMPDRMWRAVFAALTVDAEARVKSIDDLLGIWTGEVLPHLEPNSRVPDTVDLPLETEEAPAAPAPPVIEPVAVAEPAATDPPPAPTSPASIVTTWAPLFIGVLGAVLFTVWWTAEPPSTTPPEPVPVRQAPDPEPAIPAPQQPEPAPSPIPVAPAPVQPAALPPNPVPPPPRPAVVPVPQPAQPEPPPAAAQGTFRFTGQAERVWLVQGATHHDAGPVPAGSYTVSARFAGRPLEPIAGLTVVVEPGKTTTIDCRAGFFTCRER